MKCLIYCTKAKPYCMVGINGHKTYLDKGGEDSVFSPDHNYIGNGKIVAEFECDKVEEIKYTPYDCTFYTDTLDTVISEPHPISSLEKASCLDYFKLHDYLYNGKEKVGYAIHIKNLKVFDEPFTIEKLYQPIDNSFCKKCKEYNTCEYSKTKCKPCKKVLLSAPQNMCKVWYNGEEYILISIRPQHTCNILNGKKTIEVRKQILNELKEAR